MKWLLKSRAVIVRNLRNLILQPFTESSHIPVLDKLSQRAVAQQRGNEPWEVADWQRHQADVCAKRCERNGDGTAHPFSARSRDRRCQQGRLWDKFLCSVLVKDRKFQREEILIMSTTIMGFLGNLQIFHYLSAPN